MSLDLNELKKQNRVEKPLIDDKRNYIYRSNINGVSYSQTKATVHVGDVGIKILDKLAESKKYEGHTYAYIVSRLVLDAAKKNKIELTQEEEQSMKRSKYTKRI